MERKTDTKQGSDKRGLRNCQVCKKLVTAMRAWPCEHWVVCSKCSDEITKGPLNIECEQCGSPIVSIME